MIKFLLIPFYSWFMLLILAASVGKETLIKYAIGEEKVLFEEYLIICAIAFVITTIKTGVDYAKRVKDRRAD